MACSRKQKTVAGQTNTEPALVTGTPIRVLICDDYAIWRAGLVQVLKRARGITVIGEAGDGSQAMKMIEELRPDVVLLDMYLPDIDGLEVLGHVSANRIPVKIIMLTVSEQDTHLATAIKKGARGYLLKDIAPTDIVEAVRTVVKGDAAFHPRIAGKLATSLSNAASNDASLTAKEREVLYLIGEGLSNTEIGRDLGISESTVRTHMRHLMKKLGVKGRGKLMSYAIQQHNP